MAFVLKSIRNYLLRGNFCKVNVYLRLSLNLYCV